MTRYEYNPNSRRMHPELNYPVDEVMICDGCRCWIVLPEIYSRRVNDKDLCTFRCTQRTAMSSLFVDDGALTRAYEVASR